MSSEQDRELLPCPFCGGEARRFCGEVLSYVECNQCRCGTHSYVHPSSAVSAWNTRAAAALAKGEGKV